MQKRKYSHVQTILPQVQQMISEGMCYREIADYYGFDSKKVIKNLVYREKKKTLSGIPKQRGRKPAKTLSEYKYENKRLQMENELLRDFLQSIERM